MIPQRPSTSQKEVIICLTDVDISEGSQSLAELGDLLLVGLDLLALLILVATLLLGVETQVLQEDDLAARGFVDSLFDFLANTVFGEDDAAAKELLQLRDNGLQAVLRVLLAIGAAQVGHEDDSLGTLLDGILDSGQSTNDTLVVGDLLVGIERDVEVDLDDVITSANALFDSFSLSSIAAEESPDAIGRLCFFLFTYSDQDPLVLEVDVGDGKLVGERHGCDVFRLDERLTVSQERD